MKGKVNDTRFVIEEEVEKGAESALNRRAIYQKRKGRGEMGRKRGKSFKKREKRKESAAHVFVAVFRGMKQASVIHK